MSEYRKLVEYSSAKESTEIFLVDDKVRGIHVQYEPGGAKELFKTCDQSIRVGDLVAVPTGAKHGLSVCRVVAVDVMFDIQNPTAVIQFIASRIDLTQFNADVEREQKILEVTRKARFNAERQRLRTEHFAGQEEVLKQLGVGTGAPAIENKPTE